MIFNKREVRKLVKHEPPFLFLDTVEILSPIQISGSFRLNRKDHNFLEGHFPGNPIMPGVLLQEILAQLAGILTFKPYLDQGYRRIDAFECDNYLVRVQDFVYKGRILPDCTIDVEATVQPTPIPYFYQINGKISVDSIVKAFGDLTIYSKIIQGPGNAFEARQSEKIDRANSKMVRVKSL